MNAPTTPLVDSSGATPVMAQFFEAKSRQPDALVFFRMGDFYELFFDDARQAAAGSKSSLVPVQLPVALSVLVSAVTGSIRPCAAKFQHVPVEDIVIGEALLVEQVAEKLPEVTGKKEHEKLEQRT